MFSPATRAQLELGRDITSQLKGQPLAEIAKVMEDCLNGRDEWLELSRSAVVNADAGNASHIEESVVALRNAFDAARLGRYDAAEKEVQVVIDKTKERPARGYLLQQRAEYLHHLDPVKAQETQLAAVQANTALLRPIKGVSYRKLEVPRDGQAATAVAFMKQFLEKNELVLWVNALTESLAWGEENSGTFEGAMRDLGLFLGYGSQQPEKESGRGPDNLWAVGALKYFVIECKSGATQAQAINKHDCNQLNGSMTWFSAQYDQTCSATPIMVHPKTKPEFAATLHAASRIIEGDRLVKLIKALNDYAVAIGQNNGFAEPRVVAAQLQHFGLTPAELVARYTVKPSK